MELDQDSYTEHYGGGTKDLYYKDSEVHHIKLDQQIAVKVNNKKRFLEAILYYMDEMKTFMKKADIPHHMTLRVDKSNV
jgi:hypothetical protein